MANKLQWWPFHFLTMLELGQAENLSWLLVLRLRFPITGTNIVHNLEMKGKVCIRAKEPIRQALIPVSVA